MTERRTSKALAAFVTVAALLVMSAATASAGDNVQTKGELTIFGNPYGDGRPNPIDQGATAQVHSVEHDGSTTVTLHVKGLPADRTFGAHVHRLACSDNKAGPHYRNDPNGPASPDNEIWLDFTTNPDGNGSSNATVNFTIRPGEAKSVVIHDHGTETGGVAGPKLACIDVDF